MMQFYSILLQIIYVIISCMEILLIWKQLFQKIIHLKIMMSLILEMKAKLKELLTKYKLDIINIYIIVLNIINIVNIR